MILLITFITIIFLYLIVNWIRLLKECNRININGPTPLPILGNAHQVIVTSTEILKLSQELTNKYGDPFRVHLFSEIIVLMANPKHIEPILSHMDFITKGTSYRFLDCWLGQGLLTSTGAKWKSHRKFLTPAFHFNILQNFLPIFYKNQKVFIEKLRKMADGKSVDIVTPVALAALDNVTEAIMGVSVQAQMNSESDYVKAVEELSSIVSMRMQIPWIAEDLIFNWLPYKSRQDKAVKRIHGQSNKVIKARSEELKKANITSLQLTDDTGIKNKHAFLDLLLLAESDGKKIDAKSVQEEVDTFMFEGHDTTTAGIVYTLFCLSKHREVQEKIYDELKSIFGDDMGRDATYHELQQMKYLELVIKESLRLYPSVPLIQRMIENDCEVGNFTLIKGTSVIINIYQMQRHPELYDNPLEFCPERFNTPLTNPFNWLPFSAGPRNCIGQKFAMMELKVMISEVVKNFLILSSNVEPQLSADLILRSKNGVNIKLLQRN